MSSKNYLRSDLQVRFRFDGNQPFQLRAIESVADLLRGQHWNRADFVSGDLGSMFGPVRNRLDLSEKQLLENLEAVQRGNGITPDSSLQTIDDIIQTAVGQ